MMRLRMVLAVIVAAFIWFTVAQSHRRSVHDLSLPMITLIGLLVADKRFALWWPSLTLGGAFASAAYTKLVRTHFAWITAGAVRYHFVMDAQNAPTDLGLRIAGSYPLSVLCSLGAIVLESTIIIAALRPTRLVRLIVFGELMALLIGFWLLQGVVWPLWWVCALALLPWGDVASLKTLTPAQMTVTCVFIGVQAFATFRDVEHEPWISNYPMYSTTQDSPAAFDDEMRQRFSRVVGATDPALTPRVLALSRDAQNTLMRMA